jgi:polysaccharide biosynthesis protein PslH
MRVLFLAHRIPFPPNKGEKIRAFYELKAFINAGHEVDVFALAEGPEDAKYAAELRTHCTDVQIAPVAPMQKITGPIKSLVFGKPLSLPFFYSAELDSAIKQAMVRRNYDAIFVYSAVMMQYIPNDSRSPLLLDLVDADSSKWKQYGATSKFPKTWVYKREAKLLNLFERESVQRSRQSFFVSQKEIKAAGMEDFSNLSAAENGVNIPTLSPSAESPVGKPYVAFVGQMDYKVNVIAVTWFAKEVFPLIRERRPDVTFAIVGRAPSAEVLALRDLPGIEVTGEVPEVTRYISFASAIVAPFQISQGIHNKILEALAAGVPIVSTSGPVDPIRKELRDSILIADTASEFADAVLKVIADGRYADVAKENVAKVKKYQGWESTLRPIVDALTNTQVRDDERVQS